MDNNTLIFEIVLAVLGILGGGGGVFAFISAHQQNKTKDRASSASEWQELYNEMKARLDAQEEANESLKEEIRQLKNQLMILTNELETYKKYDTYITNLEIYSETLLNVIKPLVNEDVYKGLVNKRPQRQSKNQKSSSKRR